MRVEWKAATRTNQVSSLKHATGRFAGLTPVSCHNACASRHPKPSVFYRADLSPLYSSSPLHSS